MPTPLPLYFKYDYFSSSEVDLFIERHGGYDDEGWLKGSLNTGYNLEVRKVKVKQPVPNKDEMFFTKLLYGVVEANETVFKFNICKYFGESLNLLKYESDNSHFKIHADQLITKDQKTQRALTSIVVLSDPEEHKGGQLVFYPEYRKNAPSTLRQRPNVKKGSLIVFPSVMFHAVLPVTQGRRFSLIMWSHEENTPDE